MLWIISVPFCLCVEEYQREIFLTPRHFNPHPYEHQFAKIHDQGPVIFPESENEEPSGNNRYNIITVNGARAKHPAEDNPYARVTEKIKYLIGQTYSSTKHNEFDSVLYDALSEQGSKVTDYAPQELKYYSKPKKNNYAFAYKVINEDSGDDFSHQQSRNSKATNGEYRVKLPDGRTQIVSYKADKHGYNADVKYEEDRDFVQQPVYQNQAIPTQGEHAQQNVEINKTPVRQLIPQGRAQGYGYVTENREQQLVSPLQDNNAFILAHVPGPQSPIVSHLIGEPIDYRSQNQYYPNIQVYAIKPGDQFLQGIPTTLATPVHQKAAVRYTSTPVPPALQAHAVNEGNHGRFNINVASTYAPPVNEESGHKNVINTVDSSKNPNEALRQTLEKESNLPEGIYIVGNQGKR